MKKTIFKLFSRTCVEGYPVGFFIGLLVLILFGSMVCIFSFIHYSEEENSNIQMDLERSSKQIVHNIQMNAMYLLSSIDTLKALYYVNPNFDRKDFNAFLNTTLKNTEYQYLFWIEKVLDVDRKSFEEKVSNDINEKFEINSFDDDNNSIQIAQNKTEYYPILHAYPDNNKEIIGLDINSTDYMNETIKKSMINRKATVHLNKKVLLSKRNIDILIVSPILKKTNESKEEITHISSGLFLIEKNVRASRVEVEGGNDFTLFISTDHGEVIYQENYLNFKTLLEVQKSGLFEDRLKYESSLKIADCVFKLLVFTTEEYESRSKTYLPLLVSIISAVILVLLITYSVDQRKQKTLISKIMREKNNLINKILPLEVSVKLENGEDVVAERSNNACVFFLDIAGFTRFSSIHSPEQVIQVLIRIFNSMDLLCAKHGIEKIKTIGDAYMATCGIFPKSDDIRHNTYKMLGFALDVLESIPKEMSFHLGLQVRVGIHCGPVISGVISGYAKPHFDVWGDTVNVASRMESTGIAGQIHVSDRVYQLGKEDFDFSEHSDIIHVKGKGKMKTWYLMGRKSGEFNLKKEFSRARIQPSLFNRKQSHVHCIYPEFPSGLQAINIENNLNNSTGCENCSKILKKNYSYSPDINYYYHDDLSSPEGLEEEEEEYSTGGTEGERSSSSSNNSSGSINNRSKKSRIGGGSLKYYNNESGIKEEDEEQDQNNVESDDKKNLIVPEDFEQYKKNPKNIKINEIIKRDLFLNNSIQNVPLKLIKDEESQPPTSPLPTNNQPNYQIDSPLIPKNDKRELNSSILLKNTKTFLVKDINQMAKESCNEGSSDNSCNDSNDENKKTK